METKDLWRLFPDTYARVASGKKWERYQHLQYLSRAITPAITAGGGRFIVNMPPRHGKSEFISKWLPAWYLDNFPEKNIILTSYGDELASGFGRWVRNHLDSNEFAKTKLTMDSTAANRFDTTFGGSMITAGVGGSITGRGGHLLICDDPIKNYEEASSSVYRQRLKDWFDTTFYTRQEPGASIILLMCMVGNTSVLMGDGTNKELKNIKIGDIISSYDNGLLVKSKVLNWINQGPDKVYKITTKDGRITKANERHPFLVNRGGISSWIRLKNLKIGDKMLAVKEHGPGNNVQQKDVINQSQANDIVYLVTPKQEGPKVLCHRLQTVGHGETPESKIDTALILTNTKECLKNNQENVQYTNNHQQQTLEPIGVESSVLTTTMKQDGSGDFYATTVTSWSDTEKNQNIYDLQPNTYNFTQDEIVSIDFDGVEDVFDIQVERTENFIADGLVSHNTRWHHDDLAGYLINDHNDNWNVISLPGLAEENDPLGRLVGSPLCPQRYDNDALLGIKEGLPDQHWLSLYQQKPTKEGGEVFKREWWKYYDEAPKNIMQTVQFWDTAQKPGLTNDFTVCATWAKTASGYYLMDLFRRKLEAPDIEQALIQQFNKWKPNAVSIEDKSSGSSIIQYARRSTTIPIIPYNPGHKDKESRAINATPAIRSGNCFLPRNAPWLSDFLIEHDQFPSAAHDDQCFVAGTMIKTIYGDKPIEQLRAGDEVLTPFGSRKVISSGLTGEAFVIKNLGLTATPGHKTYCDKGFVQLSCINNNDVISKFTAGEIIKWKYLKLLSSMESPIKEWVGRESIISLSQIKIAAESVPKDFMLRYGSFIQERKFQVAFTFIISMATLITTTILTLSVCRLMSTVKYLRTSILKRLESTLIGLGILQKSGTDQMMGESGILKTQGSLSKTGQSCSENVSHANHHSKQSSLLKSSAQGTAVQDLGTMKRKVYNLAVDVDGVYYANGILVSNCDTTSMMVDYFNNLSTFNPRVRSL